MKLSLAAAAFLVLLAFSLPASAADWPMPGANPARTSWSAEEVPGPLAPLWYRPLEPYISQNVHVVAADGLVFVATARGLYAFRADDGELAWVYPTALPLGHSPAIHDGVAYVGGLDRRLHALDAKTGRRLWTFDAAGAGYRTSPLVVDGKVFLGNCDGVFYAVHAHGTAPAGKLAWQFQSGGPILYSAAYHDGKVFFASQDLHGYCLDARTGKLIWQTAKFNYTAGFHSIWPVIWAARNMVVFCGNTPNYRGNSRPGARSVANNAGHYHDLERRAIYGEQTSGYMGETGNQPGDWAEGTVTVDMARGLEYLQQYPHRRSVFVVDLATGREYTFDHRGQPAYAPFLLWGTKQQSPRAAPAVGPDSVLYQTTHYRVAASFGRGQVAGWTLGSRYLSVPNPRKHNAWDEPLGFALGGRLIYWSLCCDREMGAHALDGGGMWQYVNYNLGRLAPRYDVMWASVGDQDGTGNRLWGAYGSNNGIYHNHSAIRPFSVGHDPVGRASQVVASFAHLRRDVTPSPHYVGIPLQRAHVFDAVQHAHALSADQAKLSLLTGVGLAYPDEALPPGLHPRKPDLCLPVFGTSETLVKEFKSPCPVCGGTACGGVASPRSPSGSRVGGIGRGTCSPWDR